MIAFKERLESLFIDVPDEQRAGRGYIGCSVIGHPCDRYIWFEKTQQASVVPWQLSRRFERGKWEEKRIKTLLKHEDGVKVIAEEVAVKDPKSPLKGRYDFLITVDKTEVIVEVKTMSQSSWKRFLRQDLETYSPTYYAQVQSYLNLAVIEWCLFIAINKNTEEIEKRAIRREPHVLEGLRMKANRIASLQAKPLGLACGLTMPPECNGCVYRNKCWVDLQPDV